MGTCASASTSASASVAPLPPPPRRDFRMSMWGRGVGASDMGATVYFEGRMARVSRGDMKWAPRVSAARREFVGTCAQEDR